jgi:hypothetical protein
VASLIRRTSRVPDITFSLPPRHSLEHCAPMLGLPPVATAPGSRAQTQQGPKGRPAIAQRHPSLLFHLLHEVSGTGEDDEVTGASFMNLSTTVVRRHQSLRHDVTDAEAGLVGVGEARDATVRKDLEPLRLSSSSDAMRRRTESAPDWASRRPSIFSASSTSAGRRRRGDFWCFGRRFANACKLSCSR